MINEKQKQAETDLQDRQALELSDSSYETDVWSWYALFNLALLTLNT